MSGWLDRQPLLPASRVTTTAAADAERVVRAHADRDGFDAGPVLAALGLIEAPRPVRRRRTTVQARTARITARPWRQPLPARDPLTDDEVAWMVEQGYARPIPS